MRGVIAVAVLGVFGGQQSEQTLLVLKSFGILVLGLLTAFRQASAIAADFFYTTASTQSVV